MIGRRLALLVAAGAAVWSVAAEAQPYPARPITIVVPYAAGGVFDTMARIIGARMGELLGQSVIVENVTGAGGIIGVEPSVSAQEAPAWMKQTLPDKALKPHWDE